MIVLPPHHPVNSITQAQPLRIRSENIGNRFYSEFTTTSSFDIINSSGTASTEPYNSTAENPSPSDNLGKNPTPAYPKTTRAASRNSNAPAASPAAGNASDGGVR